MRAVLALVLAAMTQAAVAQEPVRLYAAGSLCAALNEVAAAFTAATGVTYCTNALQAKVEAPGLQIVPVPEELAVGADYGLTVIAGARPEAERFAQFVLSGAGQAILARHGFAAATQAKDAR